MESKHVTSLDGVITIQTHETNQLDNIVTMATMSNNPSVTIDAAFNHGDGAVTTSDIKIVVLKCETLQDQGQTHQGHDLNEPIKESVSGSEVKSDELKHTCLSMSSEVNVSVSEVNKSVPEVEKCVSEDELVEESCTFEDIVEEGVDEEPIAQASHSPDHLIFDNNNNLSESAGGPQMTSSPCTSPRKRSHDGLTRSPTYRLLDLDQLSCNTSVYHPASHSQSVSQMLKSSQKKIAENCTITSTKIIDVALPLGERDCNYLIDPKKGTISCHVSNTVAPSKMIKLNDVPVTSGGDTAATDLAQCYHTGFSYDIQSKDELITEIAATNLSMISDRTDTNTHKYNTGVHTSKQPDILPGLSSFRAGLKYTTNPSNSDEVDLDKVKVLPVYSGSDIYNAAHISGICDTHGELNLDGLEDKAHGKQYFLMDDDDKFEQLKLTQDLLSSSHAEDKDGGNIQDMWLIQQHLTGSRFSALWKSLDKCSSDNKENEVENSHVLSTWKVNVNKPPRAETPSNLLTSLSNVGKRLTPQDRTPHPNIGRYVFPTLSRESLDTPTLNRLLLPTSGFSKAHLSHNLNHSLHSPRSKDPLRSLANLYHTPYSSTSLNSSGSEEEGLSPPDYLAHYAYSATPYNTPDGLDSPTPKLPTAGQLNDALYRATESLSESDLTLGRQAHNAKERARRARIKLACEHLRDLVPGMTLKTDKATVFEFAVQYIAFIRRYVGLQYDKEFLRNCNPY